MKINNRAKKKNSQMKLKNSFSTISLRNNLMTTQKAAGLMRSLPTFWKSSLLNSRFQQKTKTDPKRTKLPLAISSKKTLLWMKDLKMKVKVQKTCKRILSSKKTINYRIKAITSNLLMKMLILNCKIKSKQNLIPSVIKSATRNQSTGQETQSSLKTKFRSRKFKISWLKTKSCSNLKSQRIRALIPTQSRMSRLRLMSRVKLKMTVMRKKENTFHLRKAPLHRLTLPS